MNERSLELAEAKALRRYQTAFCILTLFVIAVLLFLHTLFSSLLGEPSVPVILLLGAAFSLKVLELVWIQNHEEGLPEKTARRETRISVAATFILTGWLAFLTHRDDSPYFVLLAIPILQTAYLFTWTATAVVIGASIAMNFFWITHYFLLHPPPRPTEFLETGMIAVIYTLMGLLVWFLVDQLKHQRATLFRSTMELHTARERLAAEEKLAAIGRLASGIAHEIRNPVAMISSSLATAANSAIAVRDRNEMVQIAAKEAKRLEQLTSEFLSYARPRVPQRSSVRVYDLLSYIADAVSAHAAKRMIDVTCSPTDDLLIQIDSAQVQGALLNLVLNAIDATRPSGSVSLRASRTDALVQIDVRDTGDAIPDADLPRIFEPFFSTKPTGTGLGLAIARRVAQDHDGDLWVSCNQPGSVVFSLTLSSPADNKEFIHG